MAPADERIEFMTALGEVAGAAFSAFMAIEDKLPHPSMILNNPKQAPIPDEAVVQVALCGAIYNLVAGIQGRADEVMEPIITYAQRLREELSEYLVGSCVRQKPELQNTEAFRRWILTSSHWANPASQE